MIAILMAAAGLLGLGALLSAGGGGANLSNVWQDIAIDRVVKHEGGYKAINPNRDGAGLSLGPLQWAQRPGNLHVPLTAMYRASPTRFQEVFGPSWQTLLEDTKQPGVRPIAGHHLWEEPWLSRFRAAVEEPVFVAAMRDAIKVDRHWQGALRAVMKLGVFTTRAVALVFDASVQEGPARAMQIAEQVREEGWRGQEALRRFANISASRFRRKRAPTAPYPAAHIEWRRTGNEWHAWAGSFDLYADIRRRRMGIVEDPALGDEPLTAEG